MKAEVVLDGWRDIDSMNKNSDVSDGTTLRLMVVGETNKVKLRLVKGDCGMECVMYNFELLRALGALAEVAGIVHK